VSDRGGPFPNDLTDRGVAVHEAGHALMAHLVGMRIGFAAPFVHEAAGKVILREAVPRVVALAGMTAGLLTGLRLGSNNCEQDVIVARSQPDDGFGTGWGVLMRHRPHLDDLARWFLEHRLEARVVLAREHLCLVLPGDDVHAFLTARGCNFGDEKS
jgi:hypothetical protein